MHIHACDRMGVKITVNETPRFIISGHFLRKVAGILKTRLLIVTDFWIAIGKKPTGMKHPR